MRLVEVRAADKLKKADAEQLVSYLGSPNGSTVLALVAEKLAKNTRLYKAVAACGKTAVIDCAPLKRYELPRTVRSMAVTHGVTLTEGAAVKLVDLVGEDTVHLDSELKKIALAHRGTDAVNEHEIVDMVSRTAEVKLGSSSTPLRRETCASACCTWVVWIPCRPTRCWPCARRVCASLSARARWPIAAIPAAWPRRSKRPTGA